MKDLTRWWLAGAAAAVLLVPGRAEAQGTLFTSATTYTGGSNFQTSLSFDLSYDASGLFTLTMNNLGSYGEVFTRIALVNVPAGMVFNSAMPIPEGWVFNQTNLNGDGVPGEVYLYWAGSSPITNGIQPGSSLTFKFQAEDWAQWSGLVAYLGAGVHAQAGPETCSTKFAVWRNEQGQVVTNDGMGEGGEDYDPSCVSVPEPGTNALLAIGVLGLGFVATRRRSLTELLGRA